MLLPLLFLLPSLVSAGETFCFEDDSTWDADAIGRHNVTTPEQCQSLCASSPGCRAVTHYSGEASPHANYCEMFPSPHSPTACSSCTSGPSSCICTGPYSCSLNTVISIEVGVLDENECAEICWSDPACLYFSHYGLDSSPLQLACTTLKSCENRENNPTVRSGPSDCTRIDVIEEMYPLCYDIQTSWAHDTTVSVNNVTTAQSCQSHCFDNSDCVAFSWHKGSAGVEKGLCELFPEIGEYTDCLDCVSGRRQCTCSHNFTCNYDESHLIDFLTNITLEVDCQDLCARNPLCTWYSWFSSDSGGHFNQDCALLTSCDPSGVEDGGVLTGQGDCTEQQVLPEPCYDYALLDSFTRNIDTPDNNLCNGHSCCDYTGYSYTSPDWLGPAWYRLGGAAGQKMVESPLGQRDVCGTDWSGWMDGGHPGLADGEVSRTVFFDSGIDHERYPTDIKVINCQSFFVYYLVDAPECFLAYCAE